jgi:two-component sensor histidine kinase/PAS domain-containing protein
VTIEPIASETDVPDGDTSRLRGPAPAFRHAPDDRGEPADLETLLHEAWTAARLAEERLALTFEAADAVGWWDWDIVADRCRSSDGFARLFGVEPKLAAEGLPRAAYADAVHPEERRHVSDAIQRVLAIGGAFTHELRISGPDEAEVWILARGRCERDAAGRPVRCSGVALDITQRKAGDARKSALLELGDRLRDIADVGEIAYIAAEILAKVLGATRAGFGTVDPVHETVAIQPDWCRTGVSSIAGLHRFRDYGSFIDDLKRGEPVIISDVASDPRTARSADALVSTGIRVLVNLPVVEHGRFVLVVFVHHDRARTWNDAELAFVRNVADRTQSAIARLRAEEQRRLLHRELGHRLKNNQAMVQAIVAQTLRNAPDLDTARTSLTQRLAALGRAHDVLMSGEAEDADVRAVIEGALTLHDDGQDRIRIDGPPLRIAAPTALSLALILHELATNAAKYGALSCPNGRIAVRWSICDGDAARLDGEGSAAAEAMFGISWREEGGPPVARPTRRGFGTRLVERGLAGATTGTIRLDYPAEGFVYDLSVPLADLVRRA